MDDCELLCIKDGHFFTKNKIYKIINNKLYHNTDLNFKYPSTYFIIKDNDTIDILNNKFTAKFKIIYNKLSLVDKLMEILILEQNWNGYQAEKISREVIYNSYKFIKQIEELNITFMIEMTARDTIQFSYEDNDKYIEFEVYKDKIGVYNQEHDEDFDIHLDQDVVKIISKLLK